MNSNFLKNFFSLISKSLSCTIACSFLWNSSFSTIAFSFDAPSNSNSCLDTHGNFDIPDIIGKEEVEKNHYVDRLKEEEKDLNSFIFKNEDGTNTLRMFNHPVKYVDKSGGTKDISLEITKNIDETFDSTNHIINATFGSDISEGINLTYDDINIEMVADIDNNNRVIPVLSEDSKTLSYVIDDTTSYIYSMTYSGIKEDILVNEYTGQTEYKFLLNTNGLHPIKVDKSVFLADKNGNIGVSIGDIIIFTADEKNNTFGELKFEPVIENNVYIFTIVLDKDYLLDEKTAYPITIDPTIEINYNSGPGAIQDVTINSLTGSDGTSGSLFIGKRTTFGKSRALMRFPGLNISNLSGAEITSAYVEIRDLMCESDSLTVDCYEFTGNNWNESTATWANVNPDSFLTWLSSNDISYANGITQNTVHRYQFDILVAARRWADDPSSQLKGILFKSDYNIENGTTYIHKTFASYNHTAYQPSLVLTYASRNVSSWGTISAHGSTIIGDNRHITFVPETSGTYNIETYKYLNAPSRDTKIYLFDSSNTLIASNDDTVLGSNLYSSLSCYLTAGVTYRLFVTEYPFTITNMNCYLMIYKSSSLSTNDFSEYYDRMKDYNKIGEGSNTYNCLSYAIGITDRNTWPWLFWSPPTTEDVTTFMNSLGYIKVPSCTNNCVVAYGTSSEITHFSLVENGITKAKCGSLELMRHSSYDAYFYASSYGAPQAYYVKQSNSSYLNEPKSYEPDLSEFKNLDSSLKSDIYDIINNLELNPTMNSCSLTIETNCEAYNKLSKLGETVVPYILLYIEESSENGYTEAFLVSTIDRMLGNPFESMDLFNKGLKSKENYVFSPKWYAKQLWDEYLE